MTWRRRRSPRIAAVAALAAAVLAGACADRDERREDPLAYDARAPLNARVDAPRRVGGLSVSHVAFDAADGDEVTAVLATPADRTVRGAPCLLIVGGLRSRKENAAPIAAAAARRGISVLAIDARLHGERGTPADVDAAVRDPDRLVALLRGTVLDLRRALDLLAGQPECDPARIAFVGGSLGAFAGAILAGRDRRVRAAVLLVAGAGWREILEGQDLFLPGIEADARAFDAALERFAPYEPADWVARIAPRPVMLVNGRDDQYVSAAAARRLHAAAREPKDVLWYEGDHDALAAPEVLPAIGRFVEAALR